MRSMHRSLARAYSSTPHSLATTVKALHHLSYHMPARHCTVVTRVAKSLGQHAYWAGDCYTGGSYKLEFPHLTLCTKFVRRF